MKREFIALLLMLAVGLQGSLSAFAGTAPFMSADCQSTAMVHTPASQDSCCPQGQHAMSCCLDLCLSAISAMGSPVAPTWFAPTAISRVTSTSIFSSRADSPLIRPPIS